MAPSTARWSMDQGQRHGGADGDLVTVHDWLAGRFAGGENRRLERGDHRGELPDALHSQVADGEGGAGELVRGEPAGPCPGGEIVRLAGDLSERLAIGVTDDGNDEPVIDGDRDADADVPVAQDAGLAPETFTSGWAASATAQALASRSVTRFLMSAARRSPACARNGAACPRRPRRSGRSAGPRGRGLRSCWRGSAGCASRHVSPRGRGLHDEAVRRGVAPRAPGRRVLAADGLAAHVAHPFRGKQRQHVAAVQVTGRLLPEGAVQLFACRCPGGDGHHIGDRPDRDRYPDRRPVELPGQAGQRLQRGHGADPCRSPAGQARRPRQPRNSQSSCGPHPLFMRTAAAPCPAWPARFFCYLPAGGGESGSAGGVSVWVSDREAVPDLMCG